MEKIPDQFDLNKYQKINKQMTQGDEMVTEEQEEMSKEHYKRLLSRVIDVEAERLSKEAVPGLQERMERIIQDDVLTDEMIERVRHEYKKIKELEFLDAFSLVNDQNNHAGGAWRGKQALGAFGVSVGSIKESEIEKIKNAIDPERYNRNIAAAVDLIEAIESGDDGKINNSLKEIEIVSDGVMNVELIKMRLPAIREVLGKWKNGELYPMTSSGEAIRFRDASAEDKEKMIRNIVGRKCFLVITNLENSTDNGRNEVCLDCGGAEKLGLSHWHEY